MFNCKHPVLCTECISQTLVTDSCTHDLMVASSISGHVKYLRHCGSSLHVLRWLEMGIDDLHVQIEMTQNVILQAFGDPREGTGGSSPLFRSEIRRKEGISYSYETVCCCLTNFPVIVLYCSTQCFSHKSCSSSTTGKDAEWAAPNILAMFSTPPWT